MAGSFVTAPTSASSAEVGYVRNGGTLGGVWEDWANEPTPELQWPAFIPVYDNMRKQDAQVSSVLRAVIYPILRTGWRVDPTGCRPEVVQHVAADLGLPIKGQDNEAPTGRTRGRFAFNDHLRLALTMLPFGHSVFEQNYTWDPVAGRFHLKKLAFRPQRSIGKFNVARDGGLVSIAQKPEGNGKTPVMDVSSLVVYVLDREGGNWTGQSLLRPAYKNWLLKDRFLRTQIIAGDRNGTGVPIYTNHETGTQADLDKGTALARAARAGDNSGAGLPNGAKLEFAGVTGQLPDLMAPVRYHDEQIARAVLAHFLNLGTQTGSWALGSTFADFFTLSLQAIAEICRDTFNGHVIEDLLDANWGPDEPAPRLVFDEIGSRGDAIVGAVAQLVTSGVLRPDEDLEQFVRTSLGLPAYGGTVPFPSPLEVPA